MPSAATLTLPWAGGTLAPVTTSVSPTSGHQVAFYSIASGSTTDSLPLATAACVSLTAEMVVVAADSEAELYLRTVDTSTATCSGGRKVLADIDGGGLDDTIARYARVRAPATGMRADMADRDIQILEA